MLNYVHVGFVAVVLTRAEHVLLALIAVGYVGTVVLVVVLNVEDCPYLYVFGHGLFAELGHVVRLVGNGVEDMVLTMIGTMGVW